MLCLKQWIISGLDCSCISSVCLKGYSRLWIWSSSPLLIWSTCVGNLHWQCEWCQLTWLVQKNLGNLNIFTKLLSQEISRRTNNRVLNCNNRYICFFFFLEDPRVFWTRKPLSVENWAHVGQLQRKQLQFLWLSIQLYDYAFCSGSFTSF